MPIVTISPVVKLREGAGVVFGARRALTQYNAWQVRRSCIDMDDTAVKTYFRTWLERADCPWDVLEQYLTENSRRPRDPGTPSKPAQRRAQPQTEESNAETLQALAARGDYAGAGDLHQQMTQ